MVSSDTGKTSCCYWRRARSILITNFIKAYLVSSECSQQLYSRLSICRTGFHKVCTFRKKSSSVMKRKSFQSMLMSWLRSINRLLIPVNSLTSWYFWRKDFSCVIYTMFSKSKAIFLENIWSHMILEKSTSSGNTMY